MRNFQSKQNELIDRQQFIEYARECRRILELTNKEIAELTGVSSSHVSTQLRHPERTTMSFGFKFARAIASKEASLNKDFPCNVRGEPLDLWDPGSDLLDRMRRWIDEQRVDHLLKQDELAEFVHCSETSIARISGVSDQRRGSEKLTTQTYRVCYMIGATSKGPVVLPEWIDTAAFPVWLSVFRKQMLSEGVTDEKMAEVAGVSIERLRSWSAGEDGDTNDEYVEPYLKLYGHCKPDPKNLPICVGLNLDATERKIVGTLNYRRSVGMKKTNTRYDRVKGPKWHKLARWLNHWVDKMGLTHSEVGELAEVSSGSVGFLARGGYAVSIEVARKIVGVMHELGAKVDGIDWEFMPESVTQEYQQTDEKTDEKTDVEITPGSKTVTPEVHQKLEIVEATKDRVVIRNNGQSSGSEIVVTGKIESVEEVSRKSIL